MKTNKKRTKMQRRIIQQKIDRVSKLDEPSPSSGWIKAIRGSLGLTVRQLAERVGVAHGSIMQLENREPELKVKLDSLERAARAMNCKVVYAIVPLKQGTTLEDIIENEARRTAMHILKDVAHSMSLEKQATSEKEIQAEIERVARELVESSSSKIWDLKSDKLVGKKLKGRKRVQN